MAGIRPSNADMDAKFRQARTDAGIHLRKVNEAAVKTVEERRKGEQARIERFDSRLKR